MRYSMNKIGGVTNILTVIIEYEGLKILLNVILCKKDGGFTNLCCVLLQKWIKFMFISVIALCSFFILHWKKEDTNRKSSFLIETVNYGIHVIFQFHFRLKFYLNDLCGFLFQIYQMKSLSENADIPKIRKHKFRIISSPTYSKHEKKMLQQMEKSYLSVHSSFFS